MLDKWVKPIYNNIGGDSMIRSRTLTDDPKTSCATCEHLRYSAPSYCCNIDGEKMPDPGVITMSVCKKHKRRK